MCVCVRGLVSTRCAGRVEYVSHRNDGDKRGQCEGRDGERDGGTGGRRERGGGLRLRTWVKKSCSTAEGSPEVMEKPSRSMITTNCPLAPYRYKAEETEGAAGVRAENERDVAWGAATGGVKK